MELKALNNSVIIWYIEKRQQLFYLAVWIEYNAVYMQKVGRLPLQGETDMDTVTEQSSNDQAPYSLRPDWHHIPYVHYFWLWHRSGQKQCTMENETRGRWSTVVHYTISESREVLWHFKRENMSVEVTVLSPDIYTVYAMCSYSISLYIWHWLCPWFQACFLQSPYIIAIVTLNNDKVILNTKILPHNGRPVFCFWSPLH